MPPKRSAKEYKKMNELFIQDTLNWMAIQQKIAKDNPMPVYRPYPPSETIVDERQHNNQPGKQ